MREIEQCVHCGQQDANHSVYSDACPGLDGIYYGNSKTTYTPYCPVEAFKPTAWDRILAPSI